MCQLDPSKKHASSSITCNYKVIWQKEISFIYQPFLKLVYALKCKFISFILLKQLLFHLVTPDGLLANYLGWLASFLYHSTVFDIPFFSINYPSINYSFQLIDLHNVKTLPKQFVPWIFECDGCHENKNKTNKYTEERKKTQNAKPSKVAICQKKIKIAQYSYWHPSLIWIVKDGTCCG